MSLVDEYNEMKWNEIPLKKGIWFQVLGAVDPRYLVIYWKILFNIVEERFKKLLNFDVSAV